MRIKMLKKILNKLVNTILSPISYIVRKEIERNNEKERFDLKSTLQRQANIDSALYIQKNMQGIDSVASPSELLTRALNLSSIDGMTLEFGVFTGKSINHIAKLTSGPVYGFDSFEGLPERWRDGFQKGVFKLNQLPKVKSNVQLIKGWFNETIPSFAKDIKSDIRFLHIDCDLYSSTKTIFDLLGNKIVPGTVIVFDEYFNYIGWQEGEFKAFKEFITNRQLNYNYIGYNRNHEQVAVLISSNF